MSRLKKKVLRTFSELALSPSLELVSPFDDPFEDGPLEEFSEDLKLDTNLFKFPNPRLKNVPTFLKNFRARLHPSTSWDNKQTATRTTRKLLHCKKDESSINYCGNMTINSKCKNNKTFF